MQGAGSATVPLGFKTSHGNSDKCSLYPGWWFRGVSGVCMPLQCRVSGVMRVSTGLPVPEASVVIWFSTSSFVPKVSVSGLESAGKGSPPIF